MSPAGARLTALALLGLVLTLVYVYAVEPLWNAYAANLESIETAQFNLARINGITAQRGALQTRLATLEARRANAPMTLSAPGPALAAAGLQEQIKSLVLQSRGTLLSTQALEAGERDSFTAVSIKARMTLTNAALQQILHALESKHPYLIVTELTIARQTRQRTASGARRSVTRALDVRMQLTGYLERS